MGKQLNIQAFDQAQEHFHFSSATKQSARKNQKANKNCKKKKKKTQCKNCKGIHSQERIWIPRYLLIRTKVETVTCFLKAKK